MAVIAALKMIQKCFAEILVSVPRSNKLPSSCHPSHLVKSVVQQRENSATDESEAQKVIIDYVCYKSK